MIGNIEDISKIHIDELVKRGCQRKNTSRRCGSKMGPKHVHAKPTHNMERLMRKASGCRSRRTISTGEVNREPTDSIERDFFEFLTDPSQGYVWKRNYVCVCRKRSELEENLI